MARDRGSVRLGRSVSGPNGPQTHSTEAIDRRVTPAVTPPVVRQAPRKQDGNM
jgi:hypothetical protein